MLWKSVANDSALSRHWTQGSPPTSVLTAEGFLNFLILKTVRMQFVAPRWVIRCQGFCPRPINVTFAFSDPYGGWRFENVNMRFRDQSHAVSIPVQPTIPKVNVSMTCFHLWKRCANASLLEGHLPRFSAACHYHAFDFKKPHLDAANV